MLVGGTSGFVVPDCTVLDDPERIDVVLRELLMPELEAPEPMA